MLISMSSKASNASHSEILHESMWRTTPDPNVIHRSTTMRSEHLKDIPDLVVRLQGTRGGSTLGDLEAAFSIRRHTAERRRDAVEAVFGPLELMDRDNPARHGTATRVPRGFKSRRRGACPAEARTNPALGPSSPIQSGSSSIAGSKASRILPIAPTSQGRALGQRCSSVTRMSSG